MDIDDVGELERLKRRVSALEAERDGLLHEAERSREQNQISETLLSIAATLNTELDLEAIVSTVTEHATRLCRAQFGAFFYNVLNDKGESYMLYTLAGVDRSAFASFPMPRNTAVFRPTFEGTEVVRLDDVTKDPRYGKSAPYHGMPKGHLPVRSYLAVPVKSRSGEVLGGLFFGHAESGIFREIDERLVVGVSAQAAVAIENAKLFQTSKQAEARALEERHKLEELFMQSPALIVILKGPHHVYDFINATAMKVMREPEAVGKRLLDVMPDLPPDRLAIYDRVYQTGARHVGEEMPTLRDWNGDGNPYERVFNLVYEPYRGPKGEIEGLMVFGFEVTEQMLAKRKLEALAGELETANRAKDDFLATVSHELRTPLNAILGWVRMLRAGTLAADKQLRAIETIERNANAQVQLIEDLLDVSRIIAGKLRLDVGTVDLPSVVANAVEAINPAAHAKNITLVQTMDPNAGPILGDADRLQQIVWNLLTNAVKFTPKGGKVSVAVRKRDSYVEIIVADNGEGIESEFLASIFERFRQVDATTSRKQGGLGLGLAIVRHLVELHGGRVSVESRGVGGGSAFTVTLPLSPIRSTSIERPPALSQVDRHHDFDCPSELEGVHVLIVDDEPDARELLSEVLASCKAKVSTAASAAQALRCVKESRPDVVVSDIGMPEEDGYMFIRKLRALSPEEGGRTPAVALTAYARFEDRTRALVSGFNMHVPKPVEPTELLAVLVSLTTLFSHRR